MRGVVLEDFGGFYTVAQVAQQFGLTPNAVYLFIRAHRVPTKRAGATTMVRLEDLKGMRVSLSVVLPLVKAR